MGLFQNNYQQDDTYGLSFISGLVVLHCTCFELQGAHHQEFTFFTVQAASGILSTYFVIPDCCICFVQFSFDVPILIYFFGLFGVDKFYMYARGCLYSKKVNS